MGRARWRRRRCQRLALQVSRRHVLPTAAVSGYYFSHPEADYFGVARIGRDQVEDYAKRRGVPLAQAETWLRPNLGYET